MGWLAGWGKRVKITIDSGDIDGALSNFPVLIYLSAASGIDPDDVTFIFDEVGANSLKIAVTETDGTTECKVEIEEWDNGAEKAWLRVKVPSIASGADTDLYLYFDNAHADNNANVGIKESAPGEAVWDGNFLMVQHMNEAAGTVKDSTANDMDGTQGNTPTYAQIGKIADAVEFDGAETTGDHFNLGDPDSLSFSAFTWDAWVYLHDKGVNNTNSMMVAAKSGSAGNREWQFALDRGGTGNPWKVRPIIGNNTGNWGITAYYSTGTIALNTWTKVTVTWDGTTIKIYLQGASDSQSGYNGTIKNTGSTAYIARADTTYQFLDGLIDELRFSDIVRNAAWIKATYETSRDDLLDFGSEEPAGMEGIPSSVVHKAVGLRMELID